MEEKFGVVASTAPKSPEGSRSHQPKGQAPNAQQAGMEADGSMPGRNDAQLSCDALKQAEAQTSALSTLARVKSMLTITASDRVERTSPRRSFSDSRRVLWRGSQSLRSRSSHSQETSANSEEELGTLLPLTINGAVHTGMWAVHSCRRIGAYSHVPIAQLLLRRCCHVFASTQLNAMPWQSAKEIQTLPCRTGSHALDTTGVRDAQIAAV